MDNLLNSIKAVLYERTTSPMIGAFVVSWLGWNYRTVVIMFSELPAIQKFNYIENTLYPSYVQSGLFLLLLPAVTAAIYLFALPYPARFVHKFWRQRQKELRDDKLSVENATLLSVEESRSIRQRVIDIQSEYDRALSHSESEVENLKESLQLREQEFEKLNDELLKVKSSKLSESETEIVSDEVITKVIRSTPYRLYHNPRVGRTRSKTMLFGPEGSIIEGGNNSENSWKVSKGKLELLQSDGKVHTRFSYHPKTEVFTDTDDSDTESVVKGKFMIPEPDSAKG